MEKALFKFAVILSIFALWLYIFDLTKSKDVTNKRIDVLSKRIQLHEDLIDTLIRQSQYGTPIQVDGKSYLIYPILKPINK